MDLRLPELLAEDSSPGGVPLRRDTQSGSAETDPLTFSPVFLFMLAMMFAQDRYYTQEAETNRQWRQERHLPEPVSPSPSASPTVEEPTG